MFERFTKQARAAVEAAVAVAETSEDGWVGREHLLIGLAAVGEPTLLAAGFDPESLTAALGAAQSSDPDADALSAIGIDLDAIRDAVERDHGPDAWRAGGARPRREGGLLVGCCPPIVPSPRGPARPSSWHCAKPSPTRAASSAPRTCCGACCVTRVPQPRP